MTFDRYLDQLERHYNIIIDTNKATVTLANEPLFTATAIMGTKAVQLTLQIGPADVEMDVTHEQVFTEANLKSELKSICRFIIADHDRANFAVGVPSWWSLVDEDVRMKFARH